MPTGLNTTGTLTQALDSVTDAGRVIRPFANVMGKYVDMRRLESNTGLKFDEVALSQLTASNITETSDLEQNPQQLVSSLFQIEPILIGMSVFKSDLLDMRISKKVAAEIGQLTEMALAHKKDVDQVAAAQTASTDLGTAGNPMSASLVSAAVSRIRGNSTEHWDGPVAVVMRTFQLKDIQDEGVAGFGTYPVSGGVTEEFMRRGFAGTLFGADIVTDDNISVDSADDAIAFAFASGTGGAIVHVEGMSAKRSVVRKENIGAGGEYLYAVDQYGLGVRQQAQLFAITADSSVPA